MKIISKFLLFLAMIVGLSTMFIGMIDKELGISNIIPYWFVLGISIIVILVLMYNAIEEHVYK